MRSSTKLGPYTVHKKLGTGASASTYLATESVGHGETTLLVCLKVPHLELVRDRGFRRRFVQEAQIAARLHHPNIVQLEGVTEHEGVPFLVFDYVEGMDLAELLAATRADGVLLDWQLVVYAAREVARALEHAHEDQRDSGVRERQRPPVLHRDLAPPNILLGRSGGVYVTDFGLARTLDLPAVRSSGALYGRITYTAPEYLRRQLCDTRADLYSFGAVFFEALVGRPPYPTRHMHQREEHLALVRQGRRPTVHASRPELDPRKGPPPPGLLDFARVLDELLEPDPDKRIPSAKDLVDRLGRIPLPPSVERDLRDLVRDYEPSERRSIRAQTGELARDDASHWSSTDLRHVQHHLRPPSDGFDPERDGLRVTPAGVARLIEAFADERAMFESLDELLAAVEDDEPSFSDTDPDRPAFDLALAPAPLMPLGPADSSALSTIPTTNPSAPTAPRSPQPALPQGAVILESGAPYVPWAQTQLGPWQAAGPPSSAPDHTAQATLGAHSSTPDTPRVPPTRPTPASALRPTAPVGPPPEAPATKPSFAHTHYGLPLAPSAGTRTPRTGARRTRWALGLTASAMFLAATSICALSTASTVLVPLIYGEPLGGQVFDRFWTPLLRFAGVAGIALAAIMVAVAGGLWWWSARGTSREPRP